MPEQNESMLRIADFTRGGPNDAALYPPVLCLVEYRILQPDGQSRVTDYRGVRVGSVDVFRYAGLGAHCASRRLQHIREDRLSDYLVTIPVQARLGITQDGNTASAEPGSFVLLSTAKPFDASVSGGRTSDPFFALHTRISGAQLRQRIPQIDAYCDRPLPLRAGTGAIMQRMCELAIEEGGSLSGHEAGRFGTMLIDAVVNATADAPEIPVQDRRPRAMAYARIWSQSCRFVGDNLSNPALDLGLIAEHCRVSRRYIQAVFADYGKSVSTYIRDIRLQHCRAALQDARNAHLPITHIATTFGFSDLPYFCRAYRARFGLSPTKDRCQKT
jgi:AraC family transcriptional activator of tynA and feaB